MGQLTPETIKWEQLGFSYIDTGKRYRAYWKDGKWSKGHIETDKNITISEGSPALHYGQQCFEGLKAYRTKNGDIQLFRPEQNARRMMDSCDAMLMPHYPEEDFVRACHEVVRANADWVPPYGIGASLYLRPFLIGVGDNIGVAAAKEYIFSIFVTPVGPYFKGGLVPSKFVVSHYDRAAPGGTGAVKVGGNYASSLRAGEYAHEHGYSDAIYLDPATHTKIEEAGSANFYGITANNEFITPISPSILPSITRRSILYLAKERLGMDAREETIYLKDLDKFVEAGAMGTAAVIAPISSITDDDKVYKFYSDTEAGPITHKLYDELVGIQYGDIEAPEGWIQKVQLV